MKLDKHNMVHEYRWAAVGADNTIYHSEMFATRDEARAHARIYVRLHLRVRKALCIYCVKP